MIFSLLFSLFIFFFFAIGFFLFSVYDNSPLTIILGYLETIDSIWFG